MASSIPTSMTFGGIGPFMPFLLILLAVLQCTSRKMDSKSLVEVVTDFKDFKKLLRTKNNVMVLYSKSAKDSADILKLYTIVAEEIKGQATLAYIDCGGDGKKLCKKLKILPEPLSIKHYNNGEFHKDYDRKETIQSMVNFLKDPSGDMPWEEDETAKDIIHVSDANALGKLLNREKLPIMMMFYAPWCGFCKRLKPEYATVATEMKGHSVLAAMDVNKPENAVIRRHFNITGFPTLLYFESGNLKLRYEGENNKESIINFLKNPSKQPEKPKDTEWSEIPSDVVHLTDTTFDSVLIKESSVLVMFYAPWCGHCKKMKPEYTNAAANLKMQNIPGILGAVDATKEKSIAERYKITGYPTVKYFKNGEFLFDVNLRTADKIEEFMKDPKEPPPPPPPEIPWHSIPSDVVHLDEENFKPFLKRKKHVLVMFYAPWCGHCKKAKPEFQAAAARFKDDPKVEFSAIDCTVYTTICNNNDVRGYPTIKYFNYYKNSKLYDGGRTENDFVTFMNNPQNPVPSSLPSETSPEQWWAEIDGADNLNHLTASNFDNFINQHSSVLIMFYAPWCGHCKAMKPAFAQAALILKNEQVSGKLGTVDATTERELSNKYEIKGFPTMKYFR
ncbi:protein disulfide-isomerase A5 isoform X2 [Centruroides vittatus]|uniref:protein disulfide-isomerase A5 isoform X2 n=1 Tax=Centruroides vittatus TaxID=120091 RepID=UPI00350EA0E0